VLDLMEQGFLSFPWTEFVVLDEADKMLEIGFIDDIKKILRASNEYRQTLLFSATFPPALLEMAREYTNNPLEVATSSGVSTADTVTQYYLPIRGDDRTRDLRDLIRSSGEKDVFLVFCDRRTDVDKLMRSLERERFSVKALHGGYDQASRFRVMDAFRTGEVKVLVATDVASRGLDVNHVTVVVNLNAPRDVSDYTHRIGRTGRAGRTGTAVTFVGGLDQRKWKDIEVALPVEVHRLESARDMFQDTRGPGEKRTRGGASRGRDEGQRAERDEEPQENSGPPREGRVRRNSRDKDLERNERPSKDDAPRSRVRSRGRSDREEQTSGDRDRAPRRERSAREDRAPRRERTPREDRPSNTSNRPEGTRPRSGRQDSEDRGDRSRKAPLQKSSADSKIREERDRSPQRKVDDNPGFGAGI
jgi:superfamily II DNA/RNA helicase